MSMLRTAVGIAMLGAALVPSAYAQTTSPPSESLHTGPINYGYGPGRLPPANLEDPPPGPVAVPSGDARAQTQGTFSKTLIWPINAIHIGLLPDGRVLNFGSDAKGDQGALDNGTMYYDVWDPNLGTGKASHLPMPTTTLLPTDIFCSGQSLLPNGEMLIAGGDVTVNGVRNYSSDQTTIFTPTTNTVRRAHTMSFVRWYPTLLSLPSGEKLILGGRQDKANTPTITPEVFTPGSGWRTLWNAASDAAYGTPGTNWYYPRAFWSPSGTVAIVTYDGKIFTLDPTGDGTLTQLPTTVWHGAYDLPSVMFAPGEVLSLRTQQTAVVINFNPATPKVTPIAKTDQLRLWSNTTVLADGRVLLNGGSAKMNKLVGVAYAAQLWDPATSAWSRAASAAIARIYHSTALLLPDATVLTAGGGSPGPETNLNGEIYYPPYLYKQDGSGQPAPRPTLVAAPPAVRLGKSLDVTVGDTDAITKVTMVRTGAATHAFNSDQRFVPVTFTQKGNKVTIPVPGDPNVALPGYYLVFVFNGAGTPSIAKIVRLLA